MTGPGGFHGNFVDIPWDFHGSRKDTSVEIPFDFYSCTVLPHWGSHGTLMGISVRLQFPWFFHGTPMGRLVLLTIS